MGTAGLYLPQLRRGTSVWSRDVIPLLALHRCRSIDGDQAALAAALKAAGRKVTRAGYPEDHLDTLYSHRNCEVTGWAQTSVMSHQCDTLPGDSGSPLMLHTDDGWQLIGVQSSAPAAKDRWRADNRAISVTGFRDKLDQPVAEK